MGPMGNPGGADGTHRGPEGANGTHRDPEGADRTHDRPVSFREPLRCRKPGSLSLAGVRGLLALAKPLSRDFGNPMGHRRLIGEPLTRARVRLLNCAVRLASCHVSMWPWCLPMTLLGRKASEWLNHRRLL